MPFYYYVLETFLILAALLTLAAVAILVMGLGGFRMKQSPPPPLENPPVQPEQNLD